MKQHQNPYKFTKFDKRHAVDQNQVKTNFNFLMRTGLIMEPIPSAGRHDNNMRILKEHVCGNPYQSRSVNNLVEFAAQLANS
jgi:hypothetical protein